MTNRSHVVRLVVALAVLLIFVTFWGSPRKANSNSFQVHVAYMPNLTHAAAVYGFSQGVFQHAVPNAEIDGVSFNAGPEEMEALRAGGIDFAFIGPAPAINALAKPGKPLIRLLSGSCVGGASLICRATALIHGLQDLGGHTVAVPQLGGTQDISLRYFMAQRGLNSTDRGGSVQIVPVKNADLALLFDRGQIDAAWVPEPWASMLCVQHAARLVLDERTLWPNGQFATTVLIAREAFAEAHPEIVRSFMEAHSRVIEELTGHQEDARAKVGAALDSLTGKPLPPRVLSEAWRHLGFTGELPSASLLIDAQTEVASGYLPNIPAGSTWLAVADVR